MGFDISCNVKSCFLGKIKKKSICDLLTMPIVRKRLKNVFLSLFYLIAIHIHVYLFVLLIFFSCCLLPGAGSNQSDLIRLKEPISFLLARAVEKQSIQITVFLT